MKKLFLALIASLILLPTYGQYVVKGKIMDSENTVMPMVNVAFLNRADSTLITGAVSDLAERTTYRLPGVTILFAIPIWAIRHCIRM